MSQTQLKLIVIRAGEMGRAVEFYRCCGIGFTEERHGNDPLHFAADLDGTVLEIYPARDADDVETSTRLGFSVADLSATLILLGDRGVQIMNNPEATPWGLRAVVRDPDGRAVELMERANDAAPVSGVPEAVTAAITTFEANKRLADRAVAQVADDKLHESLDPHTNCIAVIMKHVAGNLRSRWTDFLTSDGEKPWRNRDDEFIDSFRSRAELVEFWERGWACLFETLQNLTDADLARTVLIRGEAHSVPLAIARSLAHCGYHIGQIVQVARIYAGDNWQTLTIPRGGSEQFNREKWGERGQQ